MTSDQLIQNEVFRIFITHHAPRTTLFPDSRLPTPDPLHLREAEYDTS
ncbi:hypothetical protein [Chroococcidiopsis sp.]